MDWCPIGYIFCLSVSASVFFHCDADKEKVKEATQYVEEAKKYEGLTDNSSILRQYNILKMLSE